MKGLKDFSSIIALVLPLAAWLAMALIKKIRKKQSGSAIMNAVMLGDIEQVKKLLARLASPNVRDEISGRTPLIFAAMNGHTEIVKILLEKGAEVEAKDMEGWTALRYALAYEYEEIIELLVRAGAHGEAAYKSPFRSSKETSTGPEIATREKPARFIDLFLPR